MFLALDKLDLMMPPSVSNMPQIIARKPLLQIVANWLYLKKFQAWFSY